MANNGEAQILVGLSKNSIRSLGRVDCSEYPLVLGVDPILQRTSLLHVWGQLTLLHTSDNSRVNSVVLYNSREWKYHHSVVLYNSPTTQLCCITHPSGKYYHSVMLFNSREWRYHHSVVLYNSPKWKVLPLSYVV